RARARRDGLAAGARASLQQLRRHKLRATVARRAAWCGGMVVAMETARPSEGRVPPRGDGEQRPGGEMTEVVVRRLLIDLEAPPARHWCGGDAFRSAWFNALSMSFPAGEQFFIDAVKVGVQTLPQVERERFEPAVKAFIGQEATHRRIHALF